MRNEFIDLLAVYPRAPRWRDPDFSVSPAVSLLTSELPQAVENTLASRGRLIIRGSAGDRTWTHTPWVAVLDPAITTSVREGFYVVYLLSYGCTRLYLTLNQGCTTLKDEVGISNARDELRRRASRMWERASKHANRMQPLNIDLNVDRTLWRGKLYEAGTVAAIEYDTAELPSDEQMVADLKEAVALYEHLNRDGGWIADDEILHAAVADEVAISLEQAKRYRQHRSIERQTSHSKVVKKKLGTRCMGCDFELRDLYGEIAQGVIEAHHLTALASLEDNETVRFDPAKDFAVLCPNCHRIIHRMDDCGDIEGLRALIAEGVLGKIKLT